MISLASVTEQQLLPFTGAASWQTLLGMLLEDVLAERGSLIFESQPQNVLTNKPT